MGSDIKGVVDESIDITKKTTPLGPFIEQTERLLTGKDLIGSDLKNFFNPKVPGVAGLPDFPEADAGRDIAARNAIIARMRRQAIRGKGIKSTIHTSPRGVVDGTGPKRAKLPTGFELQKPPTVR